MKMIVAAVYAISIALIVFGFAAALLKARRAV